MDRVVALFALTSVLAVAGAPVFAADPPDASFYKQLAEGGIAEVQAGKLAQGKSSNGEVKDFGAMMVKDHTTAGEQLKALADAKGIKLPDTSSAEQAADRGKLEMLTGDSFDHSYITGQITAHEDTIALLKNEIDSGKDPDAKAFAQRILPTVRTHLSVINAVAALSGNSK
jgi:putative membrane protein